MLTLHFTSLLRWPHRRGPALTLGAALAGVGLILSLQWPAGAARQDADATAYTIKREFKQGDVDRYRLVFKTVVNTGQGDIPTSLKATLRETTKEVKSDGTATIQYEAEKASIQAADQEFDVQAMLPKVTQTRNKEGQITETKLDNEADNPFGEGLRNIMQSVMRMQTYLYPTRPVKIGESWKIDPVQAKGLEANVKTDGTVTLVGKETVKALETFKLKIAQESQVNKDTKIKLDGTGHLDAKTGKIVQVSAKLEGNSEQVKQADITLSLVTGDDKDEDAKKPDAKK